MADIGSFNVKKYSEMTNRVKSTFNAYLSMLLYAFVTGQPWTVTAIHVTPQSAKKRSEEAAEEAPSNSSKKASQILLGDSSKVCH